MQRRIEVGPMKKLVLLEACGTCNLCLKKTSEKNTVIIFLTALWFGERGGLVLEHQTPNRKILGSIHTWGTLLCP